MITTDCLTEWQMLDALIEGTKAHGAKAKLAAETGYSGGYISGVVYGQYPITEKIANALGRTRVEYRRGVRYIPLQGVGQ